MAEAEILLRGQHPVSKRHAILEDDGRCAYLYITAPDKEEPVSQVWVYNRAGVPKGGFMNMVKMVFKGTPPPAAAEYVTGSSELKSPKAKQWELRWSKDGNAVALLEDKVPAAFVPANERPGYSRGIAKDSNLYGRAWSDPVYRQLFAA